MNVPSPPAIDAYLPDDFLYPFYVAWEASINLLTTNILNQNSFKLIESPLFRLRW